MHIGLRVDVDTYRGTKVGVPNLLRILDRNRAAATFFFSVGPDNMGRHLWRLARPKFFGKMLRTKAPRLYGWDIVIRGTFWPGPVIGEKLADVIRAAADAGHEIGLHAWDHHAWQTHLDRMDVNEITAVLGKGVETLEHILGRPPLCSAAPAWKCNDAVLLAKEPFAFRYNSDCRGRTVFRPTVNGRVLSQPQIPVDWPTYDEVVGRNGVTEESYNAYLLSLVKPDGLNVLTIHAEVEGIALALTFADFASLAHSRGIDIVPLGNLLPDADTVPSGTMVPREIPGREGWVACQAP
jgi:undecaprenyl phosphate-alpha-L-ara4FN deformylase